MPDKTPVYIRGMHGLGDNLHQRAVIRALLKRDYRIKLETSWPCVYHDLAGEDLSFIRKAVALRAQLKNAEREKDKFVPGPAAHHGGLSFHISYGRGTVGSGSVLQAMFASANIAPDYAEADFRLPIPESWTPPHIETDKPVMIYRPLIARPEWRGGSIRNANPDHYADLVTMVRDSFFVVSVAALEDNREWIVGPQLKADLTLNHGELSFEEMAALFARADVIYTSNGFPAVLGPAVETPTISIQGGYEPGHWLADGARHAPYLAVDTISPCSCATAGCNRRCSKAIDMTRARAAVADFIAKLGFSANIEARPSDETFSPAIHWEAPGIRPPAPRIMPRVRVGNPALLNRRRPPVRA